MLVRRRASYKASTRLPTTASPNIEDGACWHSTNYASQRHSHR